MKGNNKQHFVDLGSKQQQLKRDNQARIDQWAGKSKAREHIVHNHALNEWDQMKHHHHPTPEGIEEMTHHHTEKKK